MVNYLYGVPAGACVREMNLRSEPCGEQWIHDSYLPTLQRATVGWRYSQSSPSSESSEPSSIGSHSMCSLGAAVVLRSACTPAAVTLSQ
jgi:hypothetical protein